VASFWIGNVMLIILNIPLIGLWVRLLSLPYRYIYPSALFFICIGVWSTRSSLVLVGETLVFGIIGYVFAALEFEIAPLLLGFVLEPLVEENFRRAMILSRGDLATFVERPISAVFLGMTVILLIVQSIGLARLSRKKISAGASATLAE
jgi:putative tricarboxylic transport membrane protein